MNDYIVEYYDATGYAQFFECEARSLDHAASICEMRYEGCIVTKVSLTQRTLLAMHSAAERESGGGRE